MRGLDYGGWRTAIPKVSWWELLGALFDHLRSAVEDHNLD